MRNNKHSNFVSTTFFILCFIATPLFASSEQHDSIMLDDETEMELRLFPAEGDKLILGFPCDLGTGKTEMQAGKVLSDQGLEVWMTDLLGAHFLPIAPSSVRSLDGQEVARLIQLSVNEREGKRVILIASGHGSIPALRGARIWQQQHPQDTHLLGAILFFPNLTAGKPEPGKPLKYLPVVSQTSIPVVIMQPGNSPTRFWSRKLKKELEKGGSRVSIELLAKVRSNFYSRSDATAAEQAMTQRIPELVSNAISQLHKLEKQP